MTGAIDLHTHVVPFNIIAAMLREPSRFGAKGGAVNGVKVSTARFLLGES